ncbi:unnamed protein product [marine sediment metagenome]|uniref:Uncharacterized protein n=1 Tax=marine sediment metagenome TaxID=412755 RepID=X0X8M0_9ZZZZ
MEMDKEKTRVIFRMFNKSSEGCEVIAIFPDMEYFPELPFGNEGIVESYQHIGQHGGASWPGLEDITRPATQEEYESLFEELSWLGYKLDVVSS